MRWLSTSLQRLVAAEHPRGGWGYRPDTAPSTEPTALACLALHAQKHSSEACGRGLQWLADVQSPDGAVSIGGTSDGPYWPTALAVFAWHRTGPDNHRTFDEPIDRAVRWLERSRGVALPSNPAVFGHNTRLVGWPWVAGTHSWVEPTAYALRALCDLGKRNHPRVREGVRLLLDRALPHGGWNYGNTRVLTHTLRPFPATTGIALFALSGEQREQRIERAITYLKKTLPGVRAPWSLSWGLIGLSVWDALPSDASSLLASAATTLETDTPNVLDDALMLFAQGLLETRTLETSR